MGSRGSETKIILSLSVSIVRTGNAKQNFWSVPAGQLNWDHPTVQTWAFGKTKGIPQVINPSLLVKFNTCSQITSSGQTLTLHVQFRVFTRAKVLSSQSLLCSDSMVGHLTTLLLFRSYIMFYMSCALQSFSLVYTKHQPGICFSWVAA